MSHDLEFALNTARRWRDLGNLILLVGIIAEILIEAFWRDRPSTFSLKWCDHIREPENLAILIAGLLTLSGLWFERTKGQNADDFADQIRADLEQKIVGLAPRYWLIDAGSENIVAKIKPFVGQKVVILDCTSFDILEIDSTATGLASRLDEADWLNPWGEHILLPYPASTARSRIFNKVMFDSQDKGRCSQGVFVEIGPRASDRVRDAATALVDALN